MKRWIIITLVLVACSDSSGPESLPAPTVLGFVTGWNGLDATAPAATVFPAGETIRFRVAAVDTVPIRWIGFHIFEPFDIIDSVEVTDMRDSVDLAAFTVPPPSFVGLLRITGFASNDVGGRSEVELMGNPVSLYESISRPVLSTDLNIDIRDIALNGTADHLYLSQPDSNRIAVLSLATMSFQPPIDTPALPAGLDLTASDDSLVVAFPTLRQIGIIDLTNSGQAWDLRDLVFDTTHSRQPDNLRVSAHNKVIISITSTERTGAVGQILDYDLATSSQSLRTDVSYSETGRPGEVTESTLMERSFDHSRILLLYDNSCCPLNGQVYVSENGVFLPRRGTVQQYTPPASATVSGSRFLISRTLFDDDLTSPVAYLPPADRHVSALSLRGDTAYFQSGNGVFRTRLEDGATLERVIVPEHPLRILPLPGPGERLLILSASGIVIADLEGPVQEIQ